MRIIDKALLIAVAASLAGFGQSVAQDAAGARPAPPKAVAAPRTGAESYALGPADVVEVSVLGHPDFTTRERIDEDGTIRLTYLGQVPAANKTVQKLSDDVAKALDTGGYFNHPVVKVEVVSYASRYVTVLGNVGAPGLVPVDRAYRLSEIIAKVGGVKDTGATYVILRPKDGAERRISLDALATGDLNDDPYVSPGDKIYSPPAEMFYVSGQTKLPGVFPMLPNLTIRMAISRAGGLTDAGSDKSVTVTRGGKKLKHLDLDSKVEPGDVIIVGERLF